MSHGPIQSLQHTLSLSDISKLLASHRYHENTEHAESIHLLSRVLVDAHSQTSFPIALPPLPPGNEASIIYLPKFIQTTNHKAQSSYLVSNRTRVFQVST